MVDETNELAVAMVIVLTVVGVAAGRYPWLRMNRATIALVGATVLVTMGAITLDGAYASLDMNTLALLLGLMVVNANMRIAGFFSHVGAFVVRRARTPRALLALLMAASGLLSALFLNDTIVLAFTPLVLDVVLTLELDPIPYLVGLVIAANIGSVATIIGNPQNMLIATSSGIGYMDFFIHMAPVAGLGLAFAWVVLATVYRRELTTRALATAAAPVARIANRALLRKSVLVTAALLVLLNVGVPPPLAALIAASALLISNRLEPERMLAEVDWTLLVFFAGLFVVTGAIEQTPLQPLLERLINPAMAVGTGALAALAAVVSNLVSNVPAVLLFRHTIAAAPDARQAWFTLAMATTFAGNFTLLGSVANLIVAETARRRGVHLGFVEYLKVGVPVTLGTLGIGVAWLVLTSGPRG